MATYDRPWDVRVWMYPDAVSTLDAADWGLDVDISSYVKFPGSEGGQPITYRAGRRGESAVGGGAVDASEMNLSLDNKDGRFCPDKVDGPYWPNLDLNTPIRMGVVTAYDDFNRTVASGLGDSTSGGDWSGGGGWSVSTGRARQSQSSANTLSNQVILAADAANYDMVFTATVTNTSTGASQALGGIQDCGGNNYLMFRVDFGATAGAMSARIHRIGSDAGSSVLVTTDPLSFTYTAGELFRIRCQREGVQVRLKVWQEADPEPAEWTCTAVEDSLPAGELGIFGWKLTSNTNSPALFEFDDIEIVGLEFTGYVSEWPTEWDMTGRNSWAAIRASGVMRRLRQVRGNTLLSPLRRQLPKYNPTGYWPLEDGARALSFASAVTGRQPAKFTKMDLAADDSLPGSLAAPTFNAADGTIVAFNQTDQNGQGFAVSFLAKIGTNPLSKTRLFRVTTNRGNAARIDCSLSYNGTNGVRYIDVFDSEGNSLGTASNTVTSVTDWTADWHGFCLIVELNGGNTLGTFLNHRVGDTVAFFSQASWATGLTPWAKTITVGGTDWNGTSVAHLFCGLETLPFVSYPFFNASSGFDSENADERVERLGGEANIAVMIEPGTTVDLGPQRKIRPVENMQAAADAEAGILYEWGNGVGLRPRAARRNQSVHMELSVASRHLAEPPKPVRDDQRVRNSVTISRDNASSATAIDTDHIDRVGEYEESVSLNLYNDIPLQAHAEFRLFAGTRRAMRWPGVRLDFARNPDLLPTWRTAPYGFRLTVDTGLTQMTGADPDLLAEGYSASLDNLSWTVDLDCSDATLWDTGIYNDGTANRSQYGPTGATLDTAIDDNDTTIVVDAAGERWRTGAVTMTIAINGEHISINNISGPSSGNYTLTVASRAVNGVAKSHEVGDAVTLANNVRYGF